MKINFSDLSKFHKKIENKLIKSFKTSLKNSNFIGGKSVSSFENNFKIKNKSKYCTSVANGTDAIFIALKALNLKYGQEVIVPAHSWISSSEVVTLAGGKVKFCDICPETFNIDHKKIHKLINKNTAGIIAVHLYGHPANMIQINKIAKQNKLWVIEDCAQAHFSKIGKTNVGNFGDIATFSFFPGKNLGALGDAGVIVTNKKKYYNFAYRFSRHGSIKKHQHEFEGTNSRLDSIQAEFLNIKLSYYKKNQALRILNTNLYNNKINHPLIKKPTVKKNFTHTWHQYVIKTKYRDKLRKYLSKYGIETKIIYPNSLPFLKAYRRFNYEHSEFPIAYKHQNEILSLPNDSSVTLKEINFIINKINNF
jgi:dTDP-4-amino-4,6-dideoxygalactose transaminase